MNSVLLPACWKKPVEPTVIHLISAKHSFSLHKVSVHDISFVSAKVTVLSASNMIELIDYGRQQSETDYSNMVQLCHRFLIDHFSSEGNSFPNNPVLLRRASTLSGSPPAASPITQLMGINTTNTTICLNCKAVRQKENMIHVVDMIYPLTV